MNRPEQIIIVQKMAGGFVPVVNDLSYYKPVYATKEEAQQAGERIYQESLERKRKGLTERYVSDMKKAGLNAKQAGEALSKLAKL